MSDIQTIETRFPALQPNPPFLKPCATTETTMVAWVLATVAWVVVMGVATVVQVVAMVAQAVTMARMGMAAAVHPVAEDTGHMGSTEKLRETQANWSTQASWICLLESSTEQSFLF